MPDHSTWVLPAVLAAFLPQAGKWSEVLEALASVAKSDGPHWALQVLREPGPVSSGLRAGPDLRVEPWVVGEPARVEAVKKALSLVGEEYLEVFRAEPAASDP